MPIAYHSREVGESIDEGSILAELLSKGIRQVVGGICGDQEDTWADLGQLDSKRARSGRLSYFRARNDERGFG